MKKYNTNKVLFYGLMIISIIFAIFWVVFADENPFGGILFSDKNDTFMDFYNSIFDTATGRPYDKGCIYPPFTYLIYYFLMMIIPSDVVGSGAKAMRAEQTGQIVFLLYVIVSLGIVAYIIYNNKKGEKLEKLILLLVLLFSTPFLFALERGNIVILTLLFLLVFVFYYDSDSKVMREIALIALAMAASTKIYPAVFGLLLLRDKKYKAAIRCAVYGIVIFVAPFLFFGGLKNISVMFNNLFSTVEGFSKTGLGYKVNLVNTFRAVAKFLGINAPWYQTLANISSYVVLIISLISAFFIKEKWKAVCILAAILVIFPNFSYTYTLIFMSIPLVMFLDKKSDGSKINIIYTLCFVAMFFPCVISFQSVFAPDGEVGFYYTLGTCLESVAITLMIFLLNIEGIINIFKRRNKDG